MNCVLVMLGCVIWGGCGEEASQRSTVASSLGQRSAGEACGKPADCALDLTCGPTFTCYAPVATSGRPGQAETSVLVELATGRLGGHKAPPISPDPAGDMAAMESYDPYAVRRPSGEPGPTVDLGELKVNLKDPAGGKLLMTKLQLELDSEESRAEVEHRLGAIRYALTRLLSEQKSSDCQGQKQMESLRKQMLRRANSRLNQARIKEIWPTEWIVD